MPFEVIWTNRSKKDLKLIDNKTAEKIIEKVEEIGKRDAVFLEKVKGFKFYKLRVGKYRILIDKFSATKKLLILRAMHRRNVYKKI